jgi:hypothetical protein
MQSYQHLVMSCALYLRILLPNSQTYDIPKSLSVYPSFEVRTGTARCPTFKPMTKSALRKLTPFAFIRFSYLVFPEWKIMRRSMFRCQVYVYSHPR